MVLLSSAYAHKGQVTYAEGMLRKAAGMMRMSVDTTSREAGVRRSQLQSAACEHGVSALAAQRLAQLYTAMPKRATEAERWEQLAQAHWAHAHSNDTAAEHSKLATLHAQIGDANALSADGQKGSGAVVSLALTRLFLSNKSQ